MSNHDKDIQSDNVAIILHALFSVCMFAWYMIWYTYAYACTMQSCASGRAEVLQAYLRS